MHGFNRLPIQRFVDAARRRGDYFSPPKYGNVYDSVERKLDQPSTDLPYNPDAHKGQRFFLPREEINY